MKGRILKCEICNEDVRQVDIKKVGKIRRCPKCYKELRKNHRKELKKRYSKELEDSKPLILIKRKVKRKKYNNLTWDERKFLFGQLIKNGYNEEMAKQKIKDLSDFERQIFKDIHNKEKSEVNLNKRFKEEFSRII